MLFCLRRFLSEPRLSFCEYYERFKLDKDIVFQNVYMKPHGNVYLASFMRFVSDNREDQYIKDMVDEGTYNFLIVLAVLLLPINASTFIFPVLIIFPTVSSPLP